MSKNQNQNPNPNADPGKPTTGRVQIRPGVPDRRDLNALLPPLGNRCGACNGYGYDLFAVDRAPGYEIQRVDACTCAAERFGSLAGLPMVSRDAVVSDEDAGRLFVRDLEDGVEYARQRALWLSAEVGVRTDAMTFGLLDIRAGNIAPPQDGPIVSPAVAEALANAGVPEPDSLWARASKRSRCAACGHVLPVCNRQIRSPEPGVMIHVEGACNMTTLPELEHELRAWMDLRGYASDAPPPSDPGVTADAHAVALGIVARTDADQEWLDAFVEIWDATCAASDYLRWRSENEPDLRDAGVC